MHQRYVIVGITAVAALWMYIDRVCFSTLATPMKAELLRPLAPEPAADDLFPGAVGAAALVAAGGDQPLDPGHRFPELVAAAKKRWTDDRMSFALGAFFFTYALFQIPMGTLADRYGTRTVLALSIAAWSLVTMLTGFVLGFVALFAVRLLLGVTEAGAYPAAAGLVKNWARPKERGLCSSVVAFGGRAGGAAAPFLTAALAAALAGVAVVEWLVPTTPAAPAPDGTPPANWRGVFVVYGFCGLAVAALFWLVVRDRPTEPPTNEDSRHPGADAPGSPSLSPGGETLLPPEEGQGKETVLAAELTLLRRIGRLARTRNMGLFGAVQFGVNLGWAFVITLLPTYLNETFGIPLDEVGSMQSAALTIGCLGMVCGGVFTDYLRARLGPKRGRSVPIVAALTGCAVVFLVIPLLPSAWAVVAALGAMAFLVDLHNPSLWSFAQDVGGRNVGAALGWGNMWGNLGAALSPVLLNAIRQAAGWNTAFICCGGAFACAAVCGLMLDATKPVDPPTT
jgi:MFS family permease